MDITRVAALKGQVITGTFQTFQWPAYSAAITMIVPKKHYARAGAMTELDMARKCLENYRKLRST